MTERKRILDVYTRDFIHRYYPEIKQRSDSIDWGFHVIRLVTQSGGKLTTDEINKHIYVASDKILKKQSTFEKEIDRLCKIFDLRESWVQLLKMGVRISWVNMIKELYYKILYDHTIPNNKLYFAIKEMYTPLTDFLPIDIYKS